MSNQTERAEAGTRSRMTEDDKAKYTGIARHPLARRWMLNRLVEARDKAVAANTEQAIQRWALEADRVSGELQRAGYKMGESK